jgi:hypothetical protein
MRVAPEAESLRAHAFRLHQPAVTSSGRSLALNAIKFDGLCAELVWKITGLPFSFQLSDHSGTWWSLRLEPQGSATKLNINGASVELPATTKKDREFHLYLDASVAELICDRKHAVTTRIYRKPEGPLRLVLGDSDLAQLTALQAWQLRPISSDRLTS